MYWYRRSLNAFLISFGLAIAALILSDIGAVTEARNPASIWQYLAYPAYAGFAAAAAASLYSFYSGLRAWASDRLICWWVAVPLLMIAGLVYQLGDFFSN